MVILGGGCGGLPLARQIEANKKLSSTLDVVLVDKKEYFEVNLASVRFLVDSKDHNLYCAQYTKYLKTTRFVCGEVTTIHADPREVQVTNREGVVEQIPYDYLVIALGTRYPFFKAEVPTLAARTEEVVNHSQRVRNANHVLVVGGRSVGLEITGEILEAFPDKRVTIVDSGDTLMSVWPKGAVAKLNKFVARHKNLTVVMNKRVVRSEENRHELSDGSFIEADMKILATGITPNCEPLRQFFESSLTPSGYIKVQKTLQLEGHNNIFAMGDIADTGNPAKMAANIKDQYVLTSKNIEALILGKKLGTIGAPTMIYPGLVTLGPSYAILALPMFGGTSMGGKFLSNVKSGLFQKMAKNPNA